MKFIKAFLVTGLFFLVQGQEEHDFAHSAKCSFQCQGKCGENLQFEIDSRTGCHVYPCNCVEAKKQNNAEEGKIFEGDMLITAALQPIVDTMYGRATARSIFHIKRFYWPQNKATGLYYIPYKVDKSITDKRILENIPFAVREFRAKTCIRFVPYAGQDNYINIKSAGGCYAHIGMNGGEQTVSLQNNGCHPKGTTLHELMHALGFFHEQSRSDRDDYIRINRNNILQGMEGNFDKRVNAVSLDSPYDYGSVMHYRLDSFSKNGRDTMVPLKKTDADIGQRDGFSDIDIDQINRLYPCSQAPTTQKPRITRPTKPALPTNPVVIRPSTTPRPTTRKTTTTTTQRTTRTTVKTTTKPQRTCKNIINNCDGWQQRGYCDSEHKYFKYARKYCKDTCNLCPRLTTTPKPKEAVVESCIDTITTRTCKSWVRKGYCEHKIFKVYLQPRCAKSCSFCSSGGIIRKDFVVPDEMMDSY